FALHRFRPASHGCRRLQGLAMLRPTLAFALRRLRPASYGCCQLQRLAIPRLHSPLFHPLSALVRGLAPPHPPPALPLPPLPSLVRDLAMPRRFAIPFHLLRPGPPRGSQPTLGLRRRRPRNCRRRSSGCYLQRPRHSLLAVGLPR